MKTLQKNILVLSLFLALICATLVTAAPLSEDGDGSMVHSKRSGGSDKRFILSTSQKYGQQCDYNWNCKNGLCKYGKCQIPPPKST